MRLRFPEGGERLHGQSTKEVKDIGYILSTMNDYRILGITDGQSKAVKTLGDDHNLLKENSRKLVNLLKK